MNGLLSFVSFHPDNIKFMPKFICWNHCPDLSAKSRLAVKPATTKIVLKTLCIGAVFLLSTSQLLAQPGMGPSPVVVSRVISVQQSDSMTFAGSLVPNRTTTLGSAGDGRVVGLYVDEGDPVKMLPSDPSSKIRKGQPLVQLRTVALDIQIEAAQVELQLRQQAEKELQQSLPTEIAAAKAAVEEVQARLEYSKENYDRLKGLSTSGGGLSANEVQEAFSNYQSQSQLLAGSKFLLEKLTSTRETRLSQARLRVDAQSAEIKRLNEQRDELTIRAPFDGYVTSLNTELGQWVSRGDTVLEIVQLNPIELVISVPQTYISKLQDSFDRAREQSIDLVARVKVDSVSDSVTGKVIQIVPQANLRSRSFPVRIQIDNPKTNQGHLLKSGMIANASLFVGNADSKILLVKKDALVLGGPQKSLYVISKDPAGEKMVVKRVSVKIGATIGDWIQVTGDIAENDQVVVEGNERLRPMQEVRISGELRDRPPTVKQTAESDADRPSSNSK